MNNPSTTAAIVPKSFSLSDIVDALATGWRAFRRLRGPSMAFAGMFALIGLALLTVVGRFNASPMALPVAGGFMLVGPALLTGFFRLAAIADEDRKPRFRDALAAFASAPPGLWLIAGVCALLFLIWMTDALVLYAFMIGAEPLPYERPWLMNPRHNLLAFELWAALMGSVLAFMVLSISAFSVPLLHEGRAGAVEAVSASVRAVFKSLLPSIAWGLVLAITTLLSILLLPLLTIVLPVLAYGSLALYRKVFPASEVGAAP